jgi:hypothetical protein
MIAPAASTLLVDSVLDSSITSQPIGSDAFTISQASPVLSRANLQPSPRTCDAVGDKPKVRLGELLDAFRACLANDLIWIEDFCDDQVEISRDLYEVLEAFAQVRRQDIGENQ